MKFEIDAAKFFHVRQAQSHQTARFNLRGVHVEPRAAGGAFLVATDGRLMLVALDESAIAPAPATVNVDLIAADNEPEVDEWGELVERSGTPLTWFHDFRNASTIEFYLSEWPAVAKVKWGDHAPPEPLGIATVTDGKFVDWKKAALKWLAPGVAGPGAFDPALLDRAAFYGWGVELAAKGHDRPAVIHPHGAADTVGFLMPMKAADRAGFDVQLAEELVALKSDEGKT